MKQKNAITTRTQPDVMVMTQAGPAASQNGRERTENLIEDLLRWADDGGKMPDLQVKPGRDSKTRQRIMNDG